ncbi:hypothetical protein RAS1_22610 [Phycisphaerae bacterium RAS1]|nr:hypothetical protein RAS1_22610 [Phycisphaerae bacterium RAS1]
MKRTCLRGLGPVLGLLLLAGCGNYEVTLDLEDVINEPAGTKREQLDVDILCLRPEDSKNHPELVNGTLLSDQWFKSRRDKYSDISPKRVFSLRNGEPNPARDVKRGDALLSPMDHKEGKRVYVFKINHPEALKDDAAIVVYGRYLKPTAPVVIQPCPPWAKGIQVKIGRDSMTRMNQ